jgi:hypothetical protein
MVSTINLRKPLVVKTTIETALVQQTTDLK